MPMNYGRQFNIKGKPPTQRNSAVYNSQVKTDPPPKKPEGDGSIAIPPEVHQALIEIHDSGETVLVSMPAKQLMGTAKPKRPGMKRPVALGDPKMMKSVVAKKEAEDKEKIQHLRELAELYGDKEKAEGPVKLAGGNNGRPAFLKPLGKPVGGCSEAAIPDPAIAYNQELEDWANKALQLSVNEQVDQYQFDVPTNLVEGKQEQPKPAPKPVNTPPRPLPPEVRPANRPGHGRPMGVVSAIPGTGMGPQFMRVPTKNGPGCHLIVNALAGTGKTFTVIEGANRLMGQRTPGIVGSAEQEAIWEAMLSGTRPNSIRMMAFNRSIANELKKRVPAGVEASTAHSFGMKAIQTAGFKAKMNDDKTNYILCDGWDKDHFQNFPGLLALCKQVCGLIKGNLIDWTFAEDSADTVVGWLMQKYAIEASADNLMACIEVLPYMMSEHWHRTNIIDFNDMIWFPNVHPECRVETSDLCIVDEAQDLNKAQQGLVAKAGRRIMLVGDRHQAIYAFAGADSEAMDTMNARLTDSVIGCVELPLFETRRCCQSVTRLAQTIVPAFKAMETAPEGKVIYNREEDGLGHVGEKDLVVCRTNAPIIVQCLRFLRDGKKARMQGKDVGAELIGLVKKFKVDATAEMLDLLTEMYNKESAKLAVRRYGSEAALMVLSDKVDSVRAFAHGTLTCREIIDKIERLFDDKNTEGTLFSSIHRAKGLEAGTVVFYQENKCPHPMAKSEQALAQEQNLRYVAMTRAIHTLYMTSAATKKVMDDDY